MSQNSGDLRVRRTHKLLREALIALIEERGFDALTVGEIASRAMVSRAAFYRYYQDKYDLAEQIFEEILQTMANEFDPLRQQMLYSSAPQSTSDFWAKLFEQAMNSTPLPEPWVKLFEHVAEYERFYRVLLDKKGSSWFVTKMRVYLTEMIHQRLQTLQLHMKRLADHRVVADGFVAVLLAGLLVDAITWWLEQGKPYSPSQAATYCSRLIYVILEEATKWEWR
jgi:AcrR family transcriptional regulator